MTAGLVIGSGVDGEGVEGVEGEEGSAVTVEAGVLKGGLKGVAQPVSHTVMANRQIDVNFMGIWGLKLNRPWWFCA